MSEADTLTWREQRDQHFKHGGNSPLADEQKSVFNGLAYYDYDASLDVVVTVDLLDSSEIAQIFTTKNTIRNYGRYGTFELDVEGQTVQLTIYDTPHGFFIPFVDANAGIETYAGGRYIDAEQIDDVTFRVNFNKAYNPYCVYNSRYDCPIPPKENRLDVAIRAGEKLPIGDWVKNAIGD
jgi:uncharacterized protein (DUF1684 family)